MMEALKVMTYFKISLSTHNWDRAFLLADGSMAFYFRRGSRYDLPSLKRLEWMI